MRRRAVRSPRPCRGNSRLATAIALIPLLAIGFVAADVAVAFLRARSRGASVVERVTGRPVPEPRAPGERTRIVLAWTTITGARVLCRTRWFRAYLERTTVAVGEEMNAPESARRIETFITHYAVDISDLDRDPAAFVTLNEFFARHLRDGARPIAGADDPAVAVSPTDCRLLCVAGDTGTVVRVKGRKRDIAELLGVDAVVPGCEAGLRRAREFVDGIAEVGFTAAICRLAPGDYHRFHWPVDGRWQRDELVELGGDYHSVATLAVAGPVDVLGRNRRKVAIVESTRFGEVAVLAVGAVKVGSVEITAATGEFAKGAEMGSFRYGGSTVLVVFGRDRIEWDPELVRNSADGVETLVRMGSMLGRAVGSDGP